MRNIRAEMNAHAGRKIKIYVVSQEQELLTGFQMLKDAVLRLANASDFIVQQDKTGIAEDAISVVVPDATAYLPLEDMIDFDQEIERLTKEEARLTKEIARSNGMLGNEKFVSKAPAAKVQEEREKLEKYEQMMAQVKDRLASLKDKISK